MNQILYKNNIADDNVNILLTIDDLIIPKGIHTVHTILGYEDE